MLQHPCLCSPPSLASQLAPKRKTSALAAIFFKVLRAIIGHSFFLLRVIGFERRLLSDVMASNPRLSRTTIKRLTEIANQVIHACFRWCHSPRSHLEWNLCCWLLSRSPREVVLVITEISIEMRLLCCSSHGYHSMQIPLHLQDRNIWQRAFLRIVCSAGAA